MRATKPNTRLTVRNYTRNSGPSWFERKRFERGRRALERQLVYQEKKAANFAGNEEELMRTNFLRTQLVRKRLEKVRPISRADRILEVGSGAHGLVFGLGDGFRVGIDPLAAEYKRLFPNIQTTAATAAALGEELPFEDASFDIVLSDNVVDHAERPLTIVDEIVRVLKPGGILYFTVNIHHPIYDLVSRAHGAWNALGMKFELSPFADHTVHFSERQIAAVFGKLPLTIVSQVSTIAETKAAYRELRIINADTLLKKLFFKNALFEVVAVRLAQE